MGLIVEVELDLFHGELDWWESQAAVNTILDATTAINVDFFRSHPHAPDLYAPGAFRYAADPHRARAERFKTAPYLIEDGEGDCDDFGPYRRAWLAARLGIPSANLVFWRRAAEWDPATRTWARALNYHIQVERPDGVEDPSRRLGMGS